MSKEIAWYEHHGTTVAVRADLKGKHREHCLCHRCLRLDTEHRATNCPIANLLYAVCCLADVVTPVWECPLFQEFP